MSSTKKERFFSTLKAVGRTGFGILSVPLTATGILGLTWVELTRLNETTSALASPNLTATRDWMWFLESEVSTNLGEPKNYLFDKEQVPEALGNLTTFAFTLHAISKNINLTSDRYNYNPLISIPAWIEHAQNKVEEFSQTLLPPLAHHLIKALSTGLGYSSTTLLPHLPSPMEISVATTFEPYRFVPLLPFVLGALWTMGALNIVNDASRVVAGAIRSSQRFQAKHHKDLLQAIADSFIETGASDRKHYSAERDIIIPALISVGLVKELAAYSRTLDFNSHYMQGLARELQKAISDVPSSPRSTLYAEDVAELTANIAQRAKPIVNRLRRAARNLHDDRF